VLAHYSEVSLLLEDRPDLPEELQGTKRGMLYLTQYKMIFQHKSKGSTIIRFPLQLLGECVLEKEPDSKQQHIKGNLTSIQGVIVFKFTFQYGAADCLNMIKDLSEAGELTDDPVGIEVFPLPPGPAARWRGARASHGPLLHHGPPYNPTSVPKELLQLCPRSSIPASVCRFLAVTSKRVVAAAEGRESKVKETSRTDEQVWKDAVEMGIVYACGLLK
ncbi:hypothetical protein lerEdw1_002293, partial [Lerista edwardsae]